MVIKLLEEVIFVKTYLILNMTSVFFQRTSIYRAQLLFC